MHVFICRCMWHVHGGGVCEGEVGGLGAGDGGSAKKSTVLPRCALQPAAAAPLSSHVGCRLLGTPTRLPVRVAEGGVAVEFFSGEVEGS